MEGVVSAMGSDIQTKIVGTTWTHRFSDESIDNVGSQWTFKVGTVMLVECSSANSHLNPFTLYTNSVAGFQAQNKGCRNWTLSRVIGGNWNQRKIIFSTCY